MSRAGSGAEEERIVPGTPLWDALIEEHLQRYDFAAARMARGAVVLDAGCGVGYGAARLVERGAARVVAVDLAPEAIALGRTRFGRSEIEWIVEDCHTLEGAGRRGPFDLICNFENLEHLADPRRFLGRAAELLKPGGALVTSTPSRAGTNRLRGMRSNASSGNPFHAREYDAGEFRALLAERFEHVTLHHQTLDPIERMEWEPALISLWQNPAMRVGRWLQRRLRRRPVPDRIGELLAPRNWQIRNDDPGDARVVTHLAECRAPRAAGPAA